jgi:hypothetical protein
MNNIQELLESFHSLKSWGNRSDFNKEDWDNYKKVAVAVQNNAQDVEAALKKFMADCLLYPFGSEEESKAFILMRVVFIVPESGNYEDFKSYKGWDNWPIMNSNESVNLSWPLSWTQGNPKLLANYEGAMGLPYQAVDEYNYFLGKYPFRELE